MTPDQVRFIKRYLRAERDEEFINNEFSLSEFSNNDFVEALAERSFNENQDKSPNPKSSRVSTKNTCATRLVKGLEREIGSGDGCIYVWFYPAYRKLAKLSKASRWKCKIGHTNKNFSRRILEQGPKTARVEPQIVGLVIHTDLPKTIEWGVHCTLKSELKWIREDGCGDEWYNTTPLEVEEVYNYLMNLM